MGAMKLFRYVPPTSALPASLQERNHGSLWAVLLSGQACQPKVAELIC